LADFGASKVIEMKASDDEKHSLKGTPVFMAPEIIRAGQFR
jgi:serine/threonine protein kinase